MLWLLQMTDMVERWFKRLLLAYWYTTASKTILFYLCTSSDTMSNSKSDIFNIRREVCWNDSFSNGYIVLYVEVYPIIGWNLVEPCTGTTGFYLLQVLGISWNLFLFVKKTFLFSISKVEIWSIYPSLERPSQCKLAVRQFCR